MHAHHWPQEANASGLFAPQYEAVPFPLQPSMPSPFRVLGHPNPKQATTAIGGFTESRMSLIPLSSASHGPPATQG